MYMQRKKITAHAYAADKTSHELLSGDPATRAKIPLLLLPSGPDKIRGMTPYETECSSPVEHSYYSTVCA